MEPIEQYLKSKKESSRRIYRHELQKFSDFLAAKGKSISDAGTADLDAYHADMTKRNIKPATMKRTFSMINGFMKYLAKENPEYTAPVSKRGDLIRYSSPGYAGGEHFVKLLHKFGEWIPTGKTRASYLPAVHRFFTITGKRPEETDHDDILKWLKTLHEETRQKYRRKMSDSTIRLHLSAISKFSRFLELQKHPVIPAGLLRKEAVNLPRDTGGKPQIFSPEEIRTLLETMQKTRTLIAVRDHALFSLIFCCALRVGEAVNMKTSHISFERDRVQVRIHGRKNKRKDIQTIDLTDRRDIRLLNPAREWIRQARLGENEALFCPCIWNRRDRCHEARPGTRITDNQMEKRFIVWTDKSGIRKADRRVVIHLLRHTRATDLLKNRKWDVAAVRNFMGHKNIATTDIYLH